MDRRDDSTSIPLPCPMPRPRGNAVSVRRSVCVGQCAEEPGVTV